MDHLQRFLRVERVLFRYIIEKLNMFLGKFYWTVDHKPLRFWLECLIMDKITKP